MKKSKFKYCKHSKVEGNIWRSDGISEYKYNTSKNSWVYFGPLNSTNIPWPPPNTSWIEITEEEAFVECI